MTSGNFAVAQSGGPTAAMNATLCGVIEGAFGQRRKIFGAVNGILGVINDNFTDLNKTFSNIDRMNLLKTTPSAYLGSCRYKLPDFSKGAEIYETIFDNFSAHGISMFIYIGGNDSMDTVSKLTEYAKLHKKTVAVVGVPKTIDNDLVGTAHTPGFGSAAKFVATSVSEIARDCAVYADNSITIVEIMGRNAGWLTAASALARSETGIAPHLIYLPEKPLSIEKLISDKYMVRDGKELVPTSKAFGLIQTARAMKIENLTSPELTGEWEYQLSQIEKGKETRETFMKGIEDLTRTMIQNIKNFDEESTKTEASFSPVNGKKVYETVSHFETEDGIRIRKIISSRQMSEEEIVTLLSQGHVGPLSGFRSKRGAEFTAVLEIKDGKVSFLFDAAEDSIELGEELGISPIDGSPIYDTLTTYVSQSYIDKKETGFHLNKVLLGKEISVENLKKMLAGEKTDLIQGFRSAKTHRLFDAYLKLEPKTGKLQFEFPPRDPSKSRKFFRRKTAK